jgi:hypothetical protein
MNRRHIRRLPGGKGVLAFLNDNVKLRNISLQKPVIFMRIQSCYRAYCLYAALVMNSYSLFHSDAALLTLFKGQNDLFYLFLARHAFC